MKNYEITIFTDYGSVVMTIQAVSQDAAEAFAEQMNQGHASVDEVN